MTNRISIIGSVVAALGLFFLPLLEIKPNRLASGTTFGLLELQGDFRYVGLFILAILPLVIAFYGRRLQRGWMLVAVGNLLMFLTLMIPAVAGSQLLANATNLFPEGTRISNPRVFASSAIMVSLLGAYIVVFGGLLDLQHEKVTHWQRLLAGSVGLIAIFVLLVSGRLDIYSILVEFHERGAMLSQRFVEHFVFVLVSLAAGLIIGVALGLWASRDERIEPIILYAVGIIQTIPSLALFGVLLVPLARLGDQLFIDVVRFLIFSLLIAGIVIFIFSRVQRHLPKIAQSTILVISLVLTFVPLSLFAVIFITFGFEVMMRIFETQDLLRLIAFALCGLGIFLLLRRLGWQNPSTRIIKYLALLTAGGLLLITLVNGAVQFIGTPSLGNMTVRNIGISGIGTAPAIIALTLYSLLPLVRNTYAGLHNIDPAIIDSGRGMGMTPRQIFFRIELPLAFPVIMAGVRNAGISLVGITAVASIIGAGALGDFILLGVNTTSIDLILLGAIPAVILAILLDVLMQLFETFFTSPGIRQASN